MENGVVHLYYGGEQDDETIKASSQAEADRIAMENGAEHWDYDRYQTSPLKEMNHRS